MLGIAHYLPSGPVRVRSEKIGKIVHNQDVLWYSKKPQPQGGGGRTVASGGGKENDQTPQRGTGELTTGMAAPEMVQQPPEGKRPQQPAAEACSSHKRKS